MILTVHVARFLLCFWSRRSFELSFLRSAQGCHTPQTTPPSCYKSMPSHITRIHTTPHPLYVIGCPPYVPRYDRKQSLRSSLLCACSSCRGLQGLARPDSGESLPVVIAKRATHTSGCPLLSPGGRRGQKEQG